MEVDGGKLTVLDIEVLFKFFCELVLLHEVADTDTDAVVTIHVAGADAASRRTNFVSAALCITDAVHQTMVGHDDMGTVGDADVRRVDAARRHGVHFLQTDLGVKGNAVRDDVVRALVEDPRRQEAQLVLLTGCDNGMPRVAAALETDDGVRLTRKVIDDLPFALVAPLRSCDNDG